MKKEYAIYKGEELLGIGTSKELAEKLNIKVKSLLFYMFLQLKGYCFRGVGK